MCGKWTVIPYQAGDHSWEIFKGILSRDFWMICRGPGFLAAVRFGSSAALTPWVSSTGDTQEGWERETLADGIGIGVGSKSYDDDKSWSSIVIQYSLNLRIPQHSPTFFGQMRKWKLPCWRMRAFWWRTGASLHVRVYVQYLCWIYVEYLCFLHCLFNSWLGGCLC